MFENLRYKFPSEIEFEPLQVCNASCFSCPYDWLKDEPGYNKKRMSEEQIALLLDNFGINLRKKYKFKGKGLITPFRYSDPLITPHLELIFKKAKKYDLKVQITTNARSFNKKKIDLFTNFFEQLADNIAISIIGSNKEEVKNFMKLDLNETLEKLKEIGKISPKVRGKIKVSLRELRCTKEEYLNLNVLKNQLVDIGIDTSIVKSNWMQNRLSNFEYSFNDQNYVIGCKMIDNKILRRINVMVDGNVVLCDDDATGKRIFGNVFNESIDQIWNSSLMNEHKLIYSKKMSEGKSSLICNGCSRAVLKNEKLNKQVKNNFQTIKDMTRYISNKSNFI